MVGMTREDVVVILLESLVPRESMCVVVVEVQEVVRFELFWRFLVGNDEMGLRSRD